MSQADEPQPRGLTKPIPIGQTITLASFGDGSVLVVKDGVLSTVPAGDSLASGPVASGPVARFKVVNRGLGRIALQSGIRFVSVTTAGGKGQVALRVGQPTNTETFQWIETPYGDLTLHSLATNRYIRAHSGTVFADHPGPQRGRKGGSCFNWKRAATLSRPS